MHLQQQTPLLKAGANECMDAVHACTRTNTQTQTQTHAHTHARTHTLCVNVRTLHFLQLLHSWEEVPPHYNVMDVTSSSHDTHIEEVRRHMWVDPLAVQSSPAHTHNTVLQSGGCPAQLGSCSVSHCSWLLRLHLVCVCCVLVSMPCVVSLVRLKWRMTASHLGSLRRMPGSQERRKGLWMTRWR